MKMIFLLFTLMIFSLFGCDLATKDSGTSFTIIPLEEMEISASTGEKPQSKVWYHDSCWWAVLPNHTGTKLWQLENNKWINKLHLSNSTNIKADTKAMGNLAHILLYQGAETELVTLEYDTVSKTYKHWSNRQNPTKIQLEDVGETATIDLDSSGRMWLASDDETEIHIRWSDPPYNKWSTAITLVTGISSDDICITTAFPDGSIGVLWSNQNTKRFGFRVHKNGTSPEIWTEDEIPASSSAIDMKDGMADDHLNVAVASDGTLYVAVKTSYDSINYPLIALLVRQPSGKWDNLYNVDDHGTRGIVLLNTEENRVMVVYTSYDEAKIVCKTSATKRISFGNRQTIIIGEESINNVSSTKQNFSNEILILASESGKAKAVLINDN
jgi:hypothetical protein